jgi:hypothetical protein
VGDESMQGGGRRVLDTPPCPEFLEMLHEQSSSLVGNLAAIHAAPRPLRPRLVRRMIEDGEPYCRRAAWAWLIEHAVWKPRITIVSGGVPVALERGQLCRSAIPVPAAGGGRALAPTGKVPGRRGGLPYRIRVRRGIRGAA